MVTFRADANDGHLFFLSDIVNVDADNLYGFAELVAITVDGLFPVTLTPATIPTLTPLDVANPGIEVFFEQLPDAAYRITIYRYSEGRTWRVRGGIDVSPTTAVIDFEAPLRTAITYRAEMFDIDGLSMGFTELGDAFIDVAETWIHQPMEPMLAVKLSGLLAGSAADISRATPGERVYAEGATVARHIGSRRRGVEDLGLKLFLDSTDAADVLQSMLGDYETERIAVLCIRTPPENQPRIPRTLFAATSELVEHPGGTPSGKDWITFTASVDEVEPPFPGLVLPLLTYEDIDASFATYTTADAAYATYTDRDRAYELAGASV